MAEILAVARNPNSYRITSLKNVRLRACIPHPPTVEQESRIRELETSGIYRQTQSLCKSQGSVCCICRLLTRNNIVPAPPEDAVGASNARLLTYNKAKGLVVQGLQLLFHCEYLVQVEYVASHLYALQIDPSLVAKCRVLSWWCRKLEHQCSGQCPGVCSTRSGIAGSIQHVLAAEVRLLPVVPACVRVGDSDVCDSSKPVSQGSDSDAVRARTSG